MKKIISKSTNGVIFMCPTCNMIHFEYKNLNFNFETKKEYDKFSKYFLKLDGKLLEYKNADSHFKRKIIIPIGNGNLLFLLNNNELMELKRLFISSIKTQFLNNNLITSFSKN